MTIIGTSVPRLGAVDRVTGAQVYAADIRLDNVLHVKLVSLPCAHARLVSIHRDEAARVPGVRGIFAADDLPQPVPRYGPVYADRPMLASRETKFSGEPIAAVVADTADAADAAARLLRIDFEELPAVLSITAALDGHAPLVQDAALRPDDPLAGTNTLQQWQFGWGDVDGATADLVVENDYAFPMVTHFAIEPHAFLAAPDANGVTVWSPTQHPYVLQRVVSAALQWPIARVRIVAPDPGGGFGGKGWPKVEPLMAWLALRLGQPVRLVLTLEETFQAARRASAQIHARTGVTKDGRIVFQDIRADFLLGAYADIGTRVVSKASYSACGPYRAAHARIFARALLSHTTPSTAFRGFGTPQASWAVESQLNEAAAALGIDPVEIRRRNLPAKGEAFNPNDTPADGEWNQALEKAAAAIGWSAPLAPNRGRGVSLGLKSSSTASRSVAIVRLHFDGSASVLCGTSDMGQGARTVMMQIAAQELGLAPDRIAVVMGDTSVVPFDSSTSASRSTVFMGNAIIEACDSIKKQLRQMADAIPGTKEMPPADLLKAHFGPPRGEVIGIGEAGNAYEPGHPLGGRAAFWELMCAASEVEVDPDTGEVTVHKLVLVSDVGKALNPQQVEGQDEGAAVMGLGHTLMEQLVLGADGRILNLGSLDYRIPSIKDVPLQLEAHLIENADGPGPYGSKGAGEGGTLAVAAAIGAAINQAAGITLRELPLTPEKIWRARNEKRRSTHMKHLTLVFLLGAALSAQSAGTIESHVAAANALNAATPTALINLCEPAQAARAGGGARRGGQPPAAGAAVQPARGQQAVPAAPDRSRWAREPLKVFDNLYYVGEREYSAWAVTTSAGIIIVDPIYDYSVEEQVVGGLKKLGLDPTQIKFVVVSHAHRDHAGGAWYLQERFGARVLLTAPDWDMLERNTQNWPKPKRDMVVTDGQQLTLGGTTLTFVHTFGHTPGTMSTILPVKDNGTPHVAALWGGTGFNFTITPERPASHWFDSYIASARRFREATAKAGADVFLSNHPSWDGSNDKMARLSARKAGEPHPYVIGAKAVQSYFTIAEHCAQAGKLRAAQ